ncbi:MAG TPA: SRPBCC domain-containing protein [Mycobacteriales bacterium]|nr:SRPBCC domain-containing protein [Mycobacteriales bacterium]
MSATVEPVRRTVVVPCDPAKAFALFTDEMGRWWPTGTHSVGRGDAVDVTVESRVGGEIREHLRSGQTVPWGTVTAWDPPAELAMTWHPGYGADRATDVVVRFTAHDGGTLVELVHSGWDRLPDGPAKRADYDTGWVPVLAEFAVRADAVA